MSTSNSASRDDQRRSPTGILRSAATQVSALFLPSTCAFDALRIFALSMIYVLFLLYFGTYGVANGAAGYEAWSEALARGVAPSPDLGLAWRDIGYPLVLLIGGFPWTHSFIGLTLLTASMAMAMPVLTYLALRPWFPRAAYYTAILAIVSMAPFLMFKAIHHDQPFNFLLVLNMFLFNQFVWSTRPVWLYAFTGAMFLMSLMRLIGHSFYPVMIAASLLQVRKRYLHYFICVVLFAAAVAGYQKFRTATLGSPPSVVGFQVFHNLYLNLGDFDETMPANIGPNARLLREIVYRDLLPSPAQSKAVTGQRLSPAFLEEQFLKYSADELLERIFNKSNFDYLEFIASRPGISDSVYLGAFLEMARAKPLFIAKYSIRNAYKLLGDPGWLHASHTGPGLNRAGKFFPFSGGGGEGHGYNVGDVTPEPALSEVLFLTLLRQPEFVKKLYFTVEWYWRVYYNTVQRFIMVLIFAAWIATVIGLAGKVIRGERMARWSRLWLGDLVIPATGGISIMLLINLGLTGLLVDPLYRFEYSFAMLKIMLAGVGGAVIMHLLSRLVARTWRAISGRGRQDEDQRAPVAATEPAWLHRRVGRVAAVLVVTTAVAYAGWAWFTVRVAVATPADGTIHVRSATIGANCGAARDNVLQHVRSGCSHKRECSFVFDWRAMRNPNPTCPKDFSVEWTCAANEPVRKMVWPPEPKHMSRLPITCR